MYKPRDDHPVLFSAKAIEHGGGAGIVGGTNKTGVNMPIPIPPGTN